jgi:flagellar export protein FliJ
MTPRFTFRLDAVLQHRVRGEQTAQLTLARAIAARIAATRQLERALRELQGAHDSVTMLGNQTFDPPGRMNTLYYLDRLEQSIQQQRLRLDQLATDEARARELLVQASQSRQTLERLRDRKEQEARQCQLLLAARQLDDLVTSRYVPVPQEGEPTHAA